MTSRLDREPPGSPESATLMGAGKRDETPLNPLAPKKGLAGSVIPDGISTDKKSAKAGEVTSPGRPDPESMARPRNKMLAALPDAVWGRLLPHVRHSLLFPGQSLQRSGHPVERVYFPNSGLVSAVMDSREGTQVEIGVVGREGVVGTLAALVDRPTICHFVVQIAGNACWLPAAVIREEFRRDEVLQQWMLRQLQVSMAQAAQCALCNRLHSVEERLSRWLLIVRDRLESDDIEITHEFIAQMLGTRRSGVTVALGALQQGGLVDLTRGHVIIADAEKLRNCACECYTILSHHFDALGNDPVADV